MTNYPQENIKPYNDDEKKSVQVEKMFDNIAPAYDQLNHALSWNIDKLAKTFSSATHDGCSHRHR